MLNGNVVPKIPILTYHASDIRGNAYAESDLTAFADDLAHVHREGFRILPLSSIVRRWLESPHELDSRPTVGFSCDDGTDFDFHDLAHPVAGPQRSMVNVLRSFRDAQPGAAPAPCITSFVVVSPAARRTLDRTCLIGKGWWNDDWWQEANASGVMEIASHSWDHNHETVDPGPFAGIARGTFHSIASEGVADYQIAQSLAYLRAKAPNAGASLLAYPYGETNDFLVEDYLPRRAATLLLDAAFTTVPEPLHAGSSRWALPRFVFRRDWSSPSDLARILRDARR
jgi:hypothetical protein